MTEIATADILRKAKALIDTPEKWPWEMRFGKRTNLDVATRARLDGPVAAATQFRLDAEKDGWRFEPTYGHEPVEHAFKGIRDGFVITGLARPGSQNMLPHGSISAWGPDGPALEMPIKYPGFEAIKALVYHCPECGRHDVKTTRVAFANRACADCAPALRAKLETAGWTR